MLECTSGRDLGVLSFIFGADIFVANAFGWSPLDKALQLPLRYIAFAGRNTTFMDQEGFSFFRFTSDHLTNLVLTQLAFMLVGGVLKGRSTIRNLRQLVKYGTKELNDIGTIARSMGRLLEGTAEEVAAITWSQVGRQWLIHQLSHLAGGSLMLLTFQLIGNTFGESVGVLPELLLQSLILAQVIISTDHALARKGVSSSRPVELVNRFFEERRYGFVLGGLRWIYNALTSEGVPTNIKVLAALELVVLGLKISTVTVKSIY